MLTHHELAQLIRTDLAHHPLSHPAAVQNLQAQIEHNCYRPSHLENIVHLEHDLKRKQSRAKNH